MENLFITEITGPAGSGKSTFKNRSLDGYINGDSFLDEYFNHKILFGRKITYLFIILINFKFYNIHYIAFKIILKHRYKFKTIRSYISKFSKFIFLAKRNKGNFIVDEAIIHTAFSLFVLERKLRKKDYSLLNKYLSSIPVPDKIFLKFSLNKEELIQRLLIRGHHRITGIRHNKVKDSSSSSLFSDTQQLQKAQIFVTNSLLVQNYIFDFIVSKYGNDIIEKC
tara:strand:+ start:3572 stop:4243 length:672 start_codon:yes stop_codon:yes gene_type:complete